MILLPVVVLFDIYNYNKLYDEKYIKLFSIPILTIIALGVSFLYQQTPISNASARTRFDQDNQRSCHKF